MDALVASHGLTTQLIVVVMQCVCFLLYSGSQRCHTQGGCWRQREREREREMFCFCFLIMIILKYEK